MTPRPFCRRFSALLALPLLLTVFFLAAAQSASSQAPNIRPPNIVLFNIDDLGWMDIGAQGSTFYETPQTDRLAKEGMRFTNAYSACPVCSPSRASLMSGKYPARVHFTGHITAIFRHRYPEHGRIIPPDDYMYLSHNEVSLARAIKPAGYVSASIGKWHLGSDEYWPRKHGFDLNIAGHTHGSPSGYFYPYLNLKQPWNSDIPTLTGGEDGEYLTDRLTDESIRFIQGSITGDKDRPFFLYLPHYAVHTPIQAQKPLIEKYEAKLKTDSSQFNAAYAAMIESVDRSVGRIMETLTRLGLDENTVVIYTSDNGGLSVVTRNHPLREGKGYLYEGGIRVPLIVRWPGKIEAGTVSDVPVISTDLYPTIAEIAGDSARPGKVVDGKSLMPLLTGKGEWDREDLYWYYPHYSPQAKQPGAAVRSGNYKLIEHYDPPGVELYNLAEDIGEKVDLASKMPDKAAELSKKIHDWLEESGTIMHTENAAYRP